MPKKKKRINLEDPVLIDMWNDLMRQFSSIEHDIFLNAKGNVAAGVRVRRAFQDARLKITEMKKRMISADKERRDERRKSKKK